LEPKHTVSVVIVRDDKVLLVKHKERSEHPTDTYGLPAGRIEKNETPEEAAIREAKEEVGLKVKNLKRIGKYYAWLERKDGKEYMDMITFFCEEFEDEVKGETDITEPKWLKINELDSYNLVQNVKNAIMDGINKFKSHSQR